MNRRAELVKIGEHLRSWQDVVRKEKLIYETLNLFNYDARRKTLIAEGWVPTRDVTKIQLGLRTAAVCFSLYLPTPVGHFLTGNVWDKRSTNPTHDTFLQNTSHVLQGQ